MADLGSDAVCDLLPRDHKDSHKSGETNRKADYILKHGFF